MRYLLYFLRYIAGCVMNDQKSVWFKKTPPLSKSFFKTNHEYRAFRPDNIEALVGEIHIQDGYLQNVHVAHSGGFDFPAQLI